MAILVTVVVVRLALIALSSSTVRHWLHIGSSLPDCGSAGVSAGGEGICVVGTGLFSTQTVLNVVDRAHPLRMPGYIAQLLATSVTPTALVGPQRVPPYARYHPGHSLLASFELRITNTSTRAIDLEASASDFELLVPDGGPGRLEILNVPGPPAPALWQQKIIPGSAAITGWVTFVLPLGARPLLTAHRADLLLFPFTSPRTNYDGEIRLWK